MTIRRPSELRTDILGGKIANTKSKNRSERITEYHPPSKEGMEKSKRLMNAWHQGKL